MLIFFHIEVYFYETFVYRRLKAIIYDLSSEYETYMEQPYLKKMLFSLFRRL